MTGRVPSALVPVARLIKIAAQTYRRMNCKRPASSGANKQMQRTNAGPSLSAIFVDYDNIYLSLKRKSDEAAKRFSKDAASWLRAIENGALITSTNGAASDAKRRIVMNRCYGNPVPRRNAHDSSTDMSSFPFVRHHFLRAGFEVVDCPPLTAQLKNSSDIRMVMDVRDYLTHDTYFDEFIILSGDADFTPLLHRLRAHARRTIVFANEYTAAPYTAISDGEIRESDLIAMLLGGHAQIEHVQAAAAPKKLGPIETEAVAVAPQQLAQSHMQAAPLVPQAAPQLTVEEVRRQIMSEVVSAIRAAAGPVPLEALADRALRALGHDRTIGTSWAGSGSFRELLRQSLPQDIRLTEEPPYHAVDLNKNVAPPPVQQRVIEAPQPVIVQARAPVQRVEARTVAPHVSMPAVATVPAYAAPVKTAAAIEAPHVYMPPVQVQPVKQAHVERVVPAPQIPVPQPAVAPQAPAQPQRQAHQPPAYGTRTRGIDPTAISQQALAKIQEACQAPRLAPGEYRVLFEAIAAEIGENGLAGSQTLINIADRARQAGVEIGREDVRFVLEVVSEADPWFEQGASATVFAGRFRNFVVARCRSQGLSLSADELDLIDAVFVGNGPIAPLRASAPAQQHVPQTAPPVQQRQVAQPEPRPTPVAAAPTPPPAPPQGDRRSRWWSLEEGRQHVAEQRTAMAPAGDDAGDDFPRIVRSRLRG